MPATYTLISSRVLSTTPGGVTFSSIPQTYTDLVIRMTARTDGADPDRYEFWTNSDDGGPNFGTTTLRATGTTVSTIRNSSSGASFAYYQMVGGGATANTFNSAEIYVPNYTNASSGNAINLTGVSENNSSTVYGIGASAGLRTATGAITSITVWGGGYSFQSGSSFYLYGIKNS